MPNSHSLQGPELLCIYFRANTLKGKYQTTNNLRAHRLARRSLLPRAGWQLQPVLLSATSRVHICPQAQRKLGPSTIRPAWVGSSKGTVFLRAHLLHWPLIPFSLTKGPSGSWGLEDLQPLAVQGVL